MLPRQSSSGSKADPNVSSQELAVSSWARMAQALMQCVARALEAGTADDLIEAYLCEPAVLS
jgi:hypothetical protein